MKRTSGACSRCRRFRIKCVHDKDENGRSIAPCATCVKLDVADACHYVPWGHGGIDRGFRRREDAGQVSSTSSVLPKPCASSTAPLLSPSTLAESTEVIDLPPLEEILAACHTISATHFHVGFLHMETFCDSIFASLSTKNHFLLLAILTFTARNTPCLVKRYGTPAQASAFFERQADLLMPKAMFKPSAEHVQAFLILGIAKWGEGKGILFYVLMGVAVRLAYLLKLHKETTYDLPPNPTPEEILTSESLRRTFWILQLHDHHLSAGSGRPPSFSLSDITTLLPGSEDEWTFGILPSSRSALPGTPAAASSDSVSTLPSQSSSMLSYIILSGVLWGRVALFAASGINWHEYPPWDEHSEYATLLAELNKYEQNLPPEFTFSIHTLRGYRSRGLDLGFSTIELMLRCSHIVLRRVYAPFIPVGNAAGTGNPAVMFRGTAAPEGYWKQLAVESMHHVMLLFDHLKMIQRSFPTGVPTIFIFCAWICGDVATNLIQHPSLLDKNLEAQAKVIIHQSLQLLASASTYWPMATSWYLALQAAVGEVSPSEIKAAMADRTEGGWTFGDDNQPPSDGIYRQPCSAILPSTAANPRPLTSRLNQPHQRENTTTSAPPSPPPPLPPLPPPPPSSLSSSSSSSIVATSTHTPVISYNLSEMDPFSMFPTDAGNLNVGNFFMGYSPFQPSLDLDISL